MLDFATITGLAVPQISFYIRTTMRTDSQIFDELMSRRKASALFNLDSRLEGDTTPLSETALESAEQRFGCELPSLLRRIYCDVSNGGFGDSYGFLGLVGGPVNEDGLDAISLYESYKQPDPDDDHWEWPDGLLPLCHLGCAMYHCVDCTNTDSPIIWFEPNPHEQGESWDDSFFPFCDSLAKYLNAWLDGVDLWDSQ